MDGFEGQLVALAPRLRRHARGLTGDAAQADDLVQDTLERALRYRWRFRLRPGAWWGDGADLVATVFGMYNSIDTQFTPANGSGKQKLKWGSDLVYVPLPFLGIGARLDVVHPDLDDSKRSFVVVSPRLVLKTNFVTHEQVVIQYSHYSNGDRTLLPHPFGGAGATPPFRADRPDKGVLTISASMWW